MTQTSAGKAHLHVHKQQLLKVHAMNYKKISKNPFKKFFSRLRYLWRRINCYQKWTCHAAIFNYK